MPPLLDPAPPWAPDRSDHIVLWHGCTAASARNIDRNGIDLKLGKCDVDFGQGFYTTTVKGQARQWAWIRYYDLSPAQQLGDQPAVVRFKVERGALGRLASLSFVLGDYGNLDFWSLVQHCRQSLPHGPPNDHRRPVHDWYDVVFGPVAAFWKQRVAMQGADQVSFHTQAGVELLDDLRGRSDRFRWDPVV